MPASVGGNRDGQSCPWFPQVVCTIKCQGNFCDANTEAPPRPPTLHSTENTAPRESVITAQDLFSTVQGATISPPQTGLRDDLAFSKGIADEAVQLITGDRDDDYGDAFDDFTRTGKMWAPILGLDEVTPEQVALCMIILKVRRITVSPGKRDHWVDIIGYAALGGEIALRDKKDEK
jgi:hypothetical protein